MKKGIVLIALFVFALGGCVTAGTTVNQPCSIYTDVGATEENSLIAKLIPDPCIAQRVLATAAKAPLIWGQKNYAELFEKWADQIQRYIEAGITYADLQGLVLVNIAQFNKQVGMGLLIVSEGILVFDDQTALIGDIDRELLLMSLADMRAQVQRMAAIAG